VSSASWVSLIALSGWLILMLGAFRARRLGSRKTLAMALTWGAIFLLATGIITAVSAAEQARP
jgi:hypothetical protein